MVKLTTINQIVEALVARGRLFEANIATIILKTAMIYEDKGIYEAMEYYNGAHGPNEYIEFTTEVFVPVCGDSGKNTLYRGDSTDRGKEEKND